MPFLGQVRHSILWLLSISSRVMRLEFLTFSVSVNTSMPSDTGYTHEATRFLAPLTSTMHMRHAPISFMPLR